MSESVLSVLLHQARLLSLGIVLLATARRWRAVGVAPIPFWKGLPC
ncbi:hypothetical protein [Roseateles sp.]